MSSLSFKSWENSKPMRETSRRRARLGFAYLNLASVCLASVCLATGGQSGQLDNCALEIGRKLGDDEFVLGATAVNQDVSVLARFRVAAKFDCHCLQVGCELERGSIPSTAEGG